VLYRITEECLACGTCMEACPHEAITEGDVFSIDSEKCEACGTCIETCPIGAIIEE